MAKRRTHPLATYRRPPQAPRQRRRAAAPSRRALLLGGFGAVAAGFGIAELLRAAPPLPRATPPEAARRVAASRPAIVTMEEVPLPADIYVPPEPEEPAAAPGPAVPKTEPAPLQPVPVARPSAPPRPRPATGTPTWLRNARPFVGAGAAPAVAIVIDDLGLDQARTSQAVALPGEVTLAFMTYGDRLSDWTRAARERGREYLVHLPMQPESLAVDPGPNALTTSLAEPEILRRLRWGLSRMEGYVGVNNHMGSRFTADAARMSIVLEELKARGLLFLDSRTTPRTVCPRVAAAHDLPFASRNVFLDNEATADGVRRQLAELVGVARRHGAAIGIGHPHDATLSVLAEWLPAATSQGIRVVPLTSAMRRTSLVG
ncbi:MAG TPA: divergent polysaccharide deacetylase family protein [Stellaceae bacterium]|nr:divergent polysaccharide deacetylase family protein [Stellaceae bacterium]